MAGLAGGFIRAGIWVYSPVGGFFHRREFNGMMNASSARGDWQGAWKAPPRADATAMKSNVAPPPGKTTFGNPPRDFRKVGGQFRKLSISGLIARDECRSPARGLQAQI